MTQFKIGDKVRYTGSNSDWRGQEGEVVAVLNNYSQVEYKITKPSDKLPATNHHNKVGNTVNLSTHKLSLIEPVKPIEPVKTEEFNIGDKVRFTDTSHADWVGQEGVITKIGALVTYRITKPTGKVFLPIFDIVGNEVNIHRENITVIERAPVKPESKFKVGDKVRLTKQGGNKDRMPFLNEGLEATVSRVQWYSRSEEYGYYLDIPGVTTVDYLEWVAGHEFYKGDFVKESKLKNASRKNLKKATTGNVVWDSEGDRWVRLSKKDDVWGYLRPERAEGVLLQDSEELWSGFGPISFIKP